MPSWMSSAPVTATTAAVCSVMPCESVTAALAARCGKTTLLPPATPVQNVRSTCHSSASVRASPTISSARPQNPGALQSTSVNTVNAVAPRLSRPPVSAFVAGADAAASPEPVTEKHRSNVELTSPQSGSYVMPFIQCGSAGDRISVLSVDSRPYGRRVDVGGSTYCRALTTDAHLLAICLCDPAPSARGYDAARRVRLRVEVAVGAVVRAGPAGGADRDRVAARLVALAGDEVALLGPGRRVVVLGVQHAVADDAQVERHAV